MSFIIMKHIHNELRTNGGSLLKEKKCSVTGNCVRI